MMNDEAGLGMISLVAGLVLTCRWCEGTPPGWSRREAHWSAQPSFFLCSLATRETERAESSQG